MDKIIREGLKALARPRDEVGISLYIPYNDGSEGSLKNPVTLRSILNECQKKLSEDGVKTGVIESLLRPAYDLVTNDTFWRDKYETLAIFLFHNEFYAYKLSFPQKQTVVFSKYPYLKPMLRDYLDNKRLYVLVLSAGGSSLFKFDKRNYIDITTKMMKQSSKEYADYFQIERESNYHIKRKGGGDKTRQGLISHGHDNTEQLNKTRAAEYARAMAKEVKRISTWENMPLVLAGENSGFLAAAFRKAYRGVTPMETYIQVDTAPLDMGKLQTEVGQVIETMLVEDELTNAEKMNNLSGSGYQKNEINDIVRAALEGRIESLFVDGERDAFGVITFFNEVFDVVVTGDENDEELTNIAVISTWDNGGRVFFVPGETLDGRPMMAALRY